MGELNINGLKKILAPIVRRIRLSLRRGIATLIFDKEERQLIQVNLFNGEVASDIERFQNYGRTSVPPKNSEVITAALGGNLDQLIVLVMEDKTVRPKNLAEGDNCFYHLEGHNFLLSKDGVATLTVKKLVIEATDEITMNTKKLNINVENIDIKANSIKANVAIEAPDFKTPSVSMLKHFHKDAEARPTTAPEGDL